MGRRILVIDDDAAIPELVAEILVMFGHEVQTADTAEKGLEAALAEDFDVIMVDLIMPVMDGAETTRKILAQKPDQIIGVISGHPNDPLAKAALASGAKAIIPKPFEIGALLDLLA